MKTIPFNLERAKAGDPVLINGEPAVFGSHNPNAKEDYRITAWDRVGNLWCFRGDGSSRNGSKGLTMAPKKRVVWVNVYNTDAIAWFHESKESADRKGQSDRIACVRVEFEEGEGL